MHIWYLCVGHASLYTNLSFGHNFGHFGCHGNRFPKFALYNSKYTENNAPQENKFVGSLFFVLYLFIVVLSHT